MKWIINSVIILLLFSAVSITSASDSSQAASCVDQAEGIKEIIQSAEQGNANAQRELGVMYYFGDGVPQDYKEAFKWYSKSAAQGTAAAQGALATLYYHGEGVSRDYKEAMKWYSKSAEQGYAKAQVMLGYMYYHSEGAQQDYVLAHMWFNLAAVQGSVYASEFMDITAGKMTTAQIEEAQKLAREWKVVQNQS